MCKANHTEEMSFFKRMFQSSKPVVNEAKGKEPEKGYYSGPKDFVGMGVLPGSVRASDEPTYIVKRFCLGLDETGASVRLEWIPGKRIRLVKNRKDELNIEDLPKMKLTHYKGEEKGLWEGLSDEQKLEVAAIVANANSVIQISDIFSKEISLDLMDKAYDYVSELFDPDESVEFPEAKIKILAALKAAASALKKALEEIDDDDDDDTDLVKCHRPRNVVTEVQDDSVVIEPSDDEQEWLDDDVDPVEAQENPETVETPAPAETQAKPAAETPAEPAAETTVETPVETLVETPAEPAAEPKPVFDDTPDDPAEVKKSSKKKKRNK